MFISANNFVWCFKYSFVFHAQVKTVLLTKTNYLDGHKQLTFIYSTVHNQA